MILLKPLAVTVNHKTEVREGEGGLPVGKPIQKRRDEAELLLSSHYPLRFGQAIITEHTNTDGGSLPPASCADRFSVELGEDVGDNASSRGLTKQGPAVYP